MELGVYNAKDFDIEINGVSITSLAEDMVSWEKAEAFFEPVYGATGDCVKSEINNDGHNLSLSVLPICPQLGMLIKLQKQSNPFPVWVTNKKLGIRVGGTMANVQEAPELAFGSEAEPYEFSFYVFDGVTEYTK